MDVCINSKKIGLVVMEIVDSNDILFSKFLGTILGGGGEWHRSWWW